MAEAHLPSIQASLRNHLKAPTQRDAFDQTPSSFIPSDSEMQTSSARKPALAVSEPTCSHSLVRGKQGACSPERAVAVWARKQHSGLSAQWVRRPGQRQCTREPVGCPHGAPREGWSLSTPPAAEGGVCVTRGHPGRHSSSSSAVPSAFCPAIPAPV